eukprot:CAMPEP_0196661466 /NCGR_PEP_ID=MMETSP1086-20130531/44454_1 /TAXON_ID=77921 /ORGANISM="Cyanoptyche  gloeocystis , Strain SAG4.97" /LENGTH=376 /DNA_ID=CAMNT_0041996381 /DNA_START=9 /DNA_END=1139 /DNA_ORIENTATION=+
MADAGKKAGPGLPKGAETNKPVTRGVARMKIAPEKDTAKESVVMGSRNNCDGALTRDGEQKKVVAPKDTAKEPDVKRSTDDSDSVMTIGEACKKKTIPKGFAKRTKNKDGPNPKEGGRPVDNSKAPEGDPVGEQLPNVTQKPSEKPVPPELLESTPLKPRRAPSKGRVRVDGVLPHPAVERQLFRKRAVENLEKGWPRMERKRAEIPERTFDIGEYVWVPVPKKARESKHGLPKLACFVVAKPRPKTYQVASAGAIINTSFPVHALIPMAQKDPVTSTLRRLRDLRLRDISAFIATVPEQPLATVVKRWAALWKQGLRALQKSTRATTAMLSSNKQTPAVKARVQARLAKEMVEKERKRKVAGQADAAGPSKWARA